jgi:dipeptidyl aminopeptidase/acylaminoacyl peptidase
MNLIVLVLQIATSVPAPTTISDARPARGNPNVLVSRVPEAPAQLQTRVRQYNNARRVKLFDLSPDGKKMLVGTRFADTVQLHLVETPLGARTQLTFLDEPVFDAAVSPVDENVIYYVSDAGGGEFYQVYELNRKTGRATLLTDGKSRHEALVVSPDGKRIAYSGTGRNGKDTDVYLADANAPSKGRLFLSGEGTRAPLAISRDGKKLLVKQLRAIDDADLWLVDLDSGDKQKLTPDAARYGKAGVRAVAFAPDAKSVYYVTERFSDFAELYRIDLSARADRDQPVAAPVPLSRGLPWNVEDLAVSPDGKSVAFSVNEAGLSKLYLHDVKRGMRRALETPAGVLDGLRFPLRASDRLGFTVDSATSPSDVYQLKLDGKRALTQWTRSEIGGLDPRAFPAPTLEHYPSTDGVTVSAFVYRPEARPGKVPVVILWHGGPEAQFRPFFNPVIALFTAELGVAVVAPNVRGSDGYGKKFLALDDGVKREASLADIGATLSFIAKQPDFDSSRVGVTGGSYGGYMTLATSAFYPTRIRAACEVVGISSLPTFLEHTQAYRRDLRRAEYGDERLPEVLAVQKKISPLYSVDKIDAAMFVVQGKNDPRVPQSEAEQIVTALRKRGKAAWYMLALNEGHGFQKKENKDLQTLAMFLFFEKELGAPPSGPRN